MKSWTATSAAGPGKTECGMENCHKADRVLSSGTVPSATYRRDVVPCSLIKRCCGSPVAVILFAVMSLTGCGGGQRSGAEETGTAQPVPVKALRIEQEQNISSLTYVGTVRASRSTVLSCRYSGNLVSLNVSQGQHVSKGDTVAVVNSQSVISMRDMALATLDQAEDGYERARTVHESGSMADVKWVEVQTQLAKAEASAAAARKAYEDCTVKAPYSGVIGEVYADEGVEVVIGDVDEAVLLPDAVEQALRTVQLPFQDGGPCGIAQVGTAAVGKAHEVLMVLVASACQHGVQAVQVELAEDALEQVLRDACVVEDAEGLAALAALHAL